MNKIVFCPAVRRRFVAAAMTRRISATLLSTPLIRINLAWVISEMMRARVVFPLPGGPEKITDGKRSASIARRNSFPGPRMCSWPTNSSSKRGRIRVASGAALSILVAASGSSLANRSCTSKNTACRRLCTRFCVGRQRDLHCRGKINEKRGDEAVKCAASTLRRVGGNGGVRNYPGGGLPALFFRAGGNCDNHRALRGRHPALAELDLNLCNRWGWPLPAA